MEVRGRAWEGVGPRCEERSIYGLPRWCRTTALAAMALMLKQRKPEKPRSSSTRASTPAHHSNETAALKAALGERSGNHGECYKSEDPPPAQGQRRRGACGWSQTRTSRNSIH